MLVYSSVHSNNKQRQIFSSIFKSPYYTTPVSPIFWRLSISISAAVSLWLFWLHACVTIIPFPTKLLLLRLSCSQLFSSMSSSIKLSFRAADFIRECWRCVRLWLPLLDTFGG